MLKQFVTKNSKVMAIGDGLNDFMMLKEADLRVGILSKEILQVRNTCDVIVTKFSQIVDLILVHGTWNYYRLKSICLFSIYANTIIFISFFLRLGDNDIGAIILEHRTRKLILDLLVINLTIVVIFCFDQNIERTLLSLNPNIYKDNFQSNLNIILSFIKKILLGLTDSFLVSGCLSYFFNAIINQEGYELDNTSLEQTLMYSTYIIIYLKVRIDIYKKLYIALLTKY